MSKDYDRYSAILDELASPGYRDIPRQLVESIPELREPLERLQEEWGDEKPGPINVCDLVIVPWVLPRLQSPDDGVLVQKLLSWLDTLARDQRPDFREVAITLVESLYGEPGFAEQVRASESEALADLLNLMAQPLPGSLKWWRKGVRRLLHRDP